MSDGVFGCYAGLKRWLISGAGSFFVRRDVRLWGGRRGEGSTVQAMIGRWVDRASCVRCGGGGGGGCRSLEFRLRSSSDLFNLLHNFHNGQLHLNMNNFEIYDSQGSTSPEDSVTTETQASSADGTLLVEDLLKRCHDLLSELDQFRTFLVKSKKSNVVEIRQFHNSVLAELKSLERVCEPMTIPLIVHLTHNLPALLRRPHSRTHYTHPTLLQPPLLHCRLGRR
jgi:hypothetical protein